MRFRCVVAFGPKEPEHRSEQDLTRMMVRLNVRGWVTPRGTTSMAYVAVICRVCRGNNGDGSRSSISSRVAPAQQIGYGERCCFPPQWMDGLGSQIAQLTFGRTGFPCGRSAS